MQICDFDELNHLSRLSHLQVLNLEGNPLCKRPHYRLHALKKIPNLRILDQIPVNSQELCEADSVLSREEAMMSMLLKNHCNIEKLKLWIRLVKVHIEFRKIYYNGPRVTRLVDEPNLPTVSSEQFLTLWKYEERLDYREKKQIREQLLEALCDLWARQDPKIHCGQSDSWDEVYATLIHQQQTAIAKLVSLAERYVLEMKMQWKQRAETDPGQAFRGLRASQGQIEQRHKEERESLIQEFRGTTESLLSDLRSESGFETESVSSKRSNRNPRFPPSSKQKDNFSRALSYSDLRETPFPTYTEEAPRIPPVPVTRATHAQEKQKNAISAHSTQNHRRKSSLKQNGEATRSFSNLQAGNQARNQAMVVKPSHTTQEKSGSETALLQQIMLLQQEMEERLEIEAKLQKINQQMKHRLDQYHDQNRNNVELAENEITRYKQSLEAASDINQALNERFCSLQEEYEELKCHLV